MAQRSTIDTADYPELRSVAEEVSKTQKSIVLQTDGEAVAIVLPLGSGRRINFKPTPAQIERAMSAAGGWKGLVDVDELKAQWKAARGSKRPPIEL